MLHVYGSKGIGEPVTIVGDKKGLSKLKDIIDKALKSQNIGEGDFKTVAGDEFELYAIYSNEEEMDILIAPYDNEWVEKNLHEKIIDSSKSARVFIHERKSK